MTAITNEIAGILHRCERKNSMYAAAFVTLKRDGLMQDCIAEYMEAYGYSASWNTSFGSGQA
ncbi:hypothetical protein [Nitrosomonas sp.]|uniref:hypothetical protein n=1 Tax=Nitrosomonas sp. TaxID=42353 RepID=UPI001E19C029|nr:hypothetical protein [Nitrosomonas sp.]MBX3616347.1 hypothetical protein [Nitrosomonas sp.]